MEKDVVIYYSVFLLVGKSLGERDTNCYNLPWQYHFIISWLYLIIKYATVFPEKNSI